MASRNTSPANRSGSGSGCNTPGSRRNTPSRRSNIIPPRSPVPRGPTPNQIYHPQSPNVRSRQLDIEDKKDEASLLDEEPLDTIAKANLIITGLLHRWEIS